MEFTISGEKVNEHYDLVNKQVEISKVDIAGEEIEGAKLQVIDSEDNVIDEWISTKESHNVSNLVEGQTYILHEEICVDNFVKATDIEFTVTTDKETQKIVMVDKVVEISKQDIGGEEIEGAKLQVLDKENNIVDEWISTKESHKVSNLTEGQTYILHEEVCVDNFVKATDIEFTVTTDKETQKIVMVDKVVEISKQDIGGEEIEGAKLQVLDKENNIVDEWISTKESHKVSNLIEGQTYILHEEVCVDNFVKATDMEFTVTTDKETQKIVMIDKIISIEKQDVYGNNIKGVTLKVIDTEGHIMDEWISTKEAHKVSNLIEGERYILCEEKSIEGYVKASNIEFEVSYDKETQNIVMIDKIVDIIKTDITTNKELPGAELIVTDENGNIVDKWISTTEPHHVSNLEENKIYVLTEITCPYRLSTSRKHYIQGNSR